MNKDQKELSLPSKRSPLPTAGGMEAGATPAALYALLAEQAGRYTMGESSSIPRETGEELLESICFTLGFAPELPPGQPVADRFQAGQKALWQFCQSTGELWTAVDRAAPAWCNRACRDTLAECGAFFRRYDYRFFAHRIPCMIDYPLCLPVEGEETGVRFLREYLLRLGVEFRFCNAFPPEQAPALLKKAYGDVDGLVVNQLEPVLCNALGRSLLGGDPAVLTVSQGERAALYGRFHPWREEWALRAVKRGTEKLCATLGLTDPFSRGYLLECAGNLLPRLRITEESAWGKVFITF